MRIGFTIPMTGRLQSALEAGERLGRYEFSSYWVQQGMSADALTVLSLLADKIPDAELGPAVVPIFGRHPCILALQALTAQAACGGRLTLGIGLSHKFFVEDMWGLTYDPPARNMEDYLQALLPLLRGEPVQVETKSVTARVKEPIFIQDAKPVPVVIAALGPKMLDIAGRMADGTYTVMTGPKTLRDHIVPKINRAAEAAGRPAPRVIAGMPVCVSNLADKVRDAHADQISFYSNIPSYASMLEREGISRPIDTGIFGTESEVRQAIADLSGYGVTDVIARTMWDEDTTSQTLSVLADINTG